MTADALLLQQRFDSRGEQRGSRPHRPGIDPRSEHLQLVGGEPVSRRRHKWPYLLARKLTDETFAGITGYQCGSTIAATQRRFARSEIELALGGFGIMAAETARFQNRNTV